MPSLASNLDKQQQKKKIAALLFFQHFIRTTDPT
jgi:hypothetical protein